MKQLYSVTGMTCTTCKATVEERLLNVKGVREAIVNLSKNEVEVTSQYPLNIETLQQALPEKFSISTQQKKVVSSNKSDTSKLKQLKPLFLILGYISVVSLLLHHKNWDWQAMMLDFMGLFYIVFSFFKMLDLKGFAKSFQMYDPLAKKVHAYAKVYPFIETALGLMFLMRFEVKIALIITLIVLGITTYGVTKTLLNKKTIQCACLGTTLNLPMTEATFIENAIMIVMAVIMLLF